MKLKITSVFFFLIGLGLNAIAQTCPGTYVPKVTQNCSGAIPLCDLSTTYPTGFICGAGTIPDEIPDGSCLTANEKNTTWYVFKVSQSGLLKFKIRPLDVVGTNSGNTDYDWAVFKLPAGQKNTPAVCAALTENANKFSCNFSGERGVTGMYDTTGTNQTTDSQGAGGSKFNRPRQVNTGEYYVLAVDNYTGGDQIGYTINFVAPGQTATQPGGAGAASIAPEADTIVLQSILREPNCVSNVLQFKFDRAVVCDSVRAEKFEIKGANPPYQILSVTPVNGCGSEGQSQTYNLVFTPAVTDSTYQLFVTSSIKDICQNSVRLDSIPFKIEPFLKPLKFGEDTIACPGQTVTLTADTVLAGIYTYTWKRDSVIIPGVNKSSYTFVPDTNALVKYTVIAKLQSGCVDSASRYVRLAAIPKFEMPANDTVCFEGYNVKRLLAPLIDSVAGEQLKYKWVAASRTSRTLSTTKTLEIPLNKTETYRLTITNEKGCPETKSFRIIVGDSIVPFFTADTLLGAAPLPVYFTNLSASKLNQANYTWNYMDGSKVDSTKTIGDTVYHVFNTVALQDTVPYEVKLTAYDASSAIQKKVSLNGCAKTHVTIIKVVPFIVPNVLTPNNDRKNDGFRFSGWSSEISLRVYNRWGKMVYENESYKNDWDANNLPSGTYFYYVEDKQLNIKLKGWVDVLGFKSN